MGKQYSWVNNFQNYNSKIHHNSLQYHKHSEYHIDIKFPHKAWNQAKCTVISIHSAIWSAVFGKFSNPSEQTKSVAKICIKEQKCSKNLYQTQNTKANQLVWNQSWILKQTKSLFVCLFIRFTCTFSYNIVSLQVQHTEMQYKAKLKTKSETRVTGSIPKQDPNM